MHAWFTLVWLFLAALFAVCGAWLIELHVNLDTVPAIRHEAYRVADVGKEIFTVEVLLRDHLGLDRCDLLGHSAGGNIAVQYATRHQGRVSKLALITPSLRSAGLEPDAL